MPTAAVQRGVESAGQAPPEFQTRTTLGTGHVSMAVSGANSLQANRTRMFKISTAQSFEPHFWDAIGPYPDLHDRSLVRRASTKRPSAAP